MASDSIPAGLLEALRRAGRVVFLTGSGVSAESGVPTFRDAMTGLWSRFRPEELATPEAFRRNPGFVWNWYRERRLKAMQVRPNGAHLAIARMEDLFPHSTLVTQNVDGLHQRAGSERVVELHGNLTVWRDHRSGRRVTPDPTPFAAYPAPGPDGGWLRPDVVWFGESLPREALAAAEAALAWCDLLLVVGTSAVVYPAAALVGHAAWAGAVTVEVNVEVTPAEVDHRLTGPAGVVLPRLVRAVVSRAGRSVSRRG